MIITGTYFLISKPEALGEDIFIFHFIFHFFHFILLNFCVWDHLDTPHRKKKRDLSTPHNLSRVLSFLLFSP